MLLLYSESASGGVPGGVILYDDQGGVRVYAVETPEGLLAGLADGDGAALCPAEYRWIEPFGDQEYALAMTPSGMEEVLRRDGSVALSLNPSAGEDLRLLPEAGLAMDYDGAPVYDLDAGAWLENVRGAQVFGDLTFMLEGEEKDFLFYEGPYVTDVYDRDRNPVARLNGLVWSAADGYCVVMNNDGDYDVLDGDFNAVLTGLAYAPEIRDGRIHYTRRAENPISRLLEPLKLDYRHVSWVLRHYLHVDGWWHDALVGPLAPLEYCGVADGTGVLLEVSGTAIEGPDAAGLYRVNVGGRGYRYWPLDRWGYLRPDGTWAVVPAYDAAYPFVDGAAVVRLYDDSWMLIDETGAQVGDITWRWQPDMWWLSALALPVVPVSLPDETSDSTESGDVYRLMDRRGNLIGDATYRQANEALRETYLIVHTMDGDTQLIDSSGAAAGSRSGLSGVRPRSSRAWCRAVRSPG